MDEPNTRSLWVRYAIALFLILTFLLAGHFIEKHALKAGISDADTINLSGRQRMLSQRISGFVQKLDAPDRDAAFSRALEEAIDLFEESHERLLEKAEGVPLAAGLYAIGSPAGLDAQVREFIAKVRQAMALPQGSPEIATLQRSVENAAFRPLLMQLDAAVTAFNLDAEARDAQLVKLQNATLATAVLLIFFEAAFIFLPAHRTVRLALWAARAREVDLQHRNDALSDLTDRMEHAAFHDQLTGLANREKLYADLDRRLQDRFATGAQVCVIHIDLDRFKEINDTLGHPVGDLVLQKAAEAMLASTRTKDLVARVGGDEFVIVVSLLDEDAAASARKLSDKLIGRIREPMQIDDHLCLVGASAGYAFARDDDATVNGLIGDADIALYEAKRAGRGISCEFARSMRDGMERRFALIQDMERALGAGEFVGYLQPKVSIADGRVTGFEVLTRWLHPTRGLLPPADFMDLAKETGLIDQIDQAAVMSGLDSLSRLRADGWDAPTIALNASASSLRGPDYAPDLRMAVAMRGLQATDVRVEVIEDTLISDENDGAVKTLRTLASEGFKIDIDDFGTGYASLSMLAKLDLSGLKIDKEMIVDLDDPRSRQIVEAIIGLARSMNLEVVAEGVETARQFAVLREMGCDVAQGFGVGKPMAVEDVLLWLDGYGAQPLSLQIGKM